jgi:phosphoribosylaminoimidazole-succinocarboxamide synthase
MTDEWVETISKRYIELYEKVIGQSFEPKALTDEATYSLITAALEQY